MMIGELSMNKKVSDKTEVLSLDEIKKKNEELLQKTEYLDLSVIQLKSKLDKTNKILFTLLAISIILLIVIVVFIFVKSA